MLLHLIDGESDDAVSELVSINDELARYSDKLRECPQVIVLTKTDKIKASALAAVTAATADAIRKRPAAHPDIIATSSEKGMGLPELRAAVLESVTQG